MKTQAKLRVDGVVVRREGLALVVVAPARYQFVGGAGGELHLARDRRAWAVCGVVLTSTRCYYATGGSRPLASVCPVCVRRLQGLRRDRA